MFIPKRTNFSKEKTQGSFINCDLTEYMKIPGVQSSDRPYKRFAFQQRVVYRCMKVFFSRNSSSISRLCPSSIDPAELTTLTHRLAWEAFEAANKWLPVSNCYHYNNAPKKSQNAVNTVADFLFRRSGYELQTVEGSEKTLRLTYLKNLGQMVRKTPITARKTKVWYLFYPILAKMGKGNNNHQEKKKQRPSLGASAPSERCFSSLSSARRGSSSAPRLHTCSGSGYS